MRANELREKSPEALKEELVGLRQEQFNLRMQRSSGQLASPARFKAVQKDIARIKTILNENQASN